MFIAAPDGSRLVWDRQRQNRRGALAVMLGSGTGLGPAGIVHGSQGIIVVSTEGGYATFPCTSMRENAIVEHLHKRFGHVSAERVLAAMLSR